MHKLNRIKFKILEELGIIYKGRDKFSNNFNIRKNWKEDNISYLGKELWNKIYKDKDKLKEDNMKPDKETCLVLLKDKNKNKETNLFQKPKQAEGYIKNN